jgi:hypothetical protein
MRQQSILNSLTTGFLVVFGSRSAWCGGKELTLKERVALGKAATALVEMTQGGQAYASGSAFCVHEAGLFVTNRHVLLTPHPRSSSEDARQVPLVKSVTLVLRPGETDQQEVKAQVLRVSDDLDLALLRVEGAERTFSPLALGTVDGLAETAEVMAFGFPFGKALAVDRGSYPSISVNSGRITSLRRKDGALNQIQLDAVLNPGNSGGPVLDTRGEVIGVVVSGILGMGVNFAIPVSHLRQFLSRPEILFTPPALKQDNQHDLVEFRAKAVSLLSPTEPLALQLTLETGVGKPRRYDMKLIGGIHCVKALPIPPREGPLLLRMAARYENGSVSGTVEDRSFKIGEKQIKLSEVSSLRLGAETEAVLHSGERLRGGVSGLDVVPITVGGQSYPVKLGSATKVEVVRPVEVDSVTCTIVALQAGKEVGRLTTPAYVEGVAREPVYPAMAEGRFVRPSRSAVPTSYLRAVSSPGDWIGQGKTYSYSGDQLVVRRNPRGVTITVDDWMVDFGAPGGQFLAVGEYDRARRFAFSDDAPGIDFHGKGRASNRIAGKFVVWELEIEGNAIVRLAIDFVQRSEETKPPLYGAIRINSHYR